MPRYGLRRRKTHPVWIATEGRCFYCGDAGLSADHLLPAIDGGTDADENMVPCCGVCNSVKGDRTSSEFLCLLAERSGVFVRFSERQRLWLFAKYNISVPTIPPSHVFDFWGHRNTTFRIVNDRMFHQKGA